MIVINGNGVFGSVGNNSNTRLYANHTSELKVISEINIYQRDVTGKVKRPNKNTEMYKN